MLVVGTGNSGCEIVCDLWEHGATTAVHNRSPAPFLPRWLIALMQQSGYCKPGYGSTLEACAAVNPQLCLLRSILSARCILPPILYRNQLTQRLIARRSYKALYDRTVEWLIRQSFGDIESHGLQVDQPFLNH